MEDTRLTTLEQYLGRSLIYEIGQTNLHQISPSPENQEMIAGSAHVSPPYHTAFPIPSSFMSILLQI